MLTPDDLRGIAEELRALADDLYCGHTLSGEWCDDDAKRKHDKLLAWADALVAVHAGPIKTHETIDWSRSAAEISADYLAIVRERDALRTELREADSLQCLADIRAAVGDSGQMMQRELVEHIRALRKDAERLDSGRIRLVVRDDFGDPAPTVFVQVDLRAAIDAAMAKEARDA